MGRRTIQAPERAYIRDALVASASENGGKPNLLAVARAVGRDRVSLRTIWQAYLDDPAAPVSNSAVAAAAPAAPLVASMSDVEYHQWRWDQQQVALASCTSDTAKAKLLRDQDDIRARLMAARDADGGDVAHMTEREQYDAGYRVGAVLAGPAALGVAAALRDRCIV